MWNSLPNHVLETGTGFQFENRLDRLRWQNAKFKYNYRAAPPDGTFNAEVLHHKNLGI